MTGEIKNAGIAIFTYPDGVDWGNGQTVNLVIGIASVGDEHIATLGKIATTCSSEAELTAFEVSVCPLLSISALIFPSYWRKVSAILTALTY